MFIYYFLFGYVIRTNISNIYFRCHRSQTNKQTNKQAIITTYKEFLEICIESKNGTYTVCINQ